MDFIWSGEDTENEGKFGRETDEEDGGRPSESWRMEGDGSVSALGTSPESGSASTEGGGE